MKKKEKIKLIMLVLVLPIFLISIISTYAVTEFLGSETPGELDTCKYLMENTRYESSSYLYDYWLETPQAYTDSYIWLVKGASRFIYHDTANTSLYMGTRPVIDVLKTQIDY